MDWLIRSEFAILIILYSLNSWYIISLGGTTRHIAFCFSLFVYFVYTVYTPVSNYFGGYHSLYGIDYVNYFSESIAVDIVGIFALSLGYWSSVHLRPTRPFQALQIRYDLRHPIIILSVLLLICFIALIINLVRASFDFSTLFDFHNQSNTPLLFGLSSPHPEFNYIEALSDTLVALLILLFNYKMPRRIWWILAFICGFYFLLAGWRYRFILLAVGCLAHYWYNLRWFPRDYWRVTLLALSVVLGIAVLTLNRMAIASRQGEETTLDLTRFDNRLFAEQTINAQVFMLMLRYRDEHNIQADYGQSMFKQTAYRAMPTYMFTDSIKPYPPLLKWQSEAQGTSAKGEIRTGAITNLEEYYLSFGWVGLFLLASMLGFLLGRLVHFPPTDDFYVGIKLLLTAFMFQLITRGYFPQQVELFVYLMFPILLLRAISHYHIPDIFYNERRKFK